MEIKQLTFQDELWEEVAIYAYKCSWSAGKHLSKRMTNKSFEDWERVFVALDEVNIVGFCTLVKKDCIPNVPYTPYISDMFIDEKYRGNRISQKMIRIALEYAKKLNFDKVYLVSDHENLYEKYGFVKIDEKPAPWNSDTMETIFMHLT